jgi:hypothetical protein
LIFDLSTMAAPRVFSNHFFTSISLKFFHIGSKYAWGSEQGMQ